MPKKPKSHTTHAHISSLTPLAVNDQPRHPNYFWILAVVGFALAVGFLVYTQQGMT